MKTKKSFEQRQEIALNKKVKELEKYAKEQRCSIVSGWWGSGVDVSLSFDVKGFYCVTKNKKDILRTKNLKKSVRFYNNLHKLY